MTAFLFLQNFEAGKPVAMPFHALQDILCRHGTLGRGRGDLELSLPADTIAGGCTVVGNAESGVLCVGFDRPYFDAALRTLVWECMQRLGCAVFDDSLGIVCTTLDARSALPASLAAASVFDVREISSEQQLWPLDFQMPVAQPSERPALVYPNSNPNGPKFQLFDSCDFEQKHLYIELPIVAAACNPGTLRVLRNLELRVDAAVTANPEFGLFYRYSNPESPLLVMESARLGEMSSRATIISPSPLEPSDTSTFVMDRAVFASANGQAARMAQHMQQKYQVSLDGGVASLSKVARLLDAVHAAYAKERDAYPNPQAFASTVAVNWATLAGAYLGNLICQQVGGQWGHVTCGQQRWPVVRTHKGRICNTYLLVLDHVINGPRSSVAAYFRALLGSGVSATPRGEDVVCNLPGFCDILLGRSHFNGDSGGLPLQEQIPHDQLDFSVNSLRYLDSYLAALARQRAALAQQEMANVILVAGAYLGEVIRCNTPQPTYWQWTTYDEVALQQPDFAQKRPRGYSFMAVLDGRESMTYPLAQVEAILGGAQVDSAHAYARRLVSEHRGAFAGTVLDAIDIRKAVSLLPADQRDYPSVDVPYWGKAGAAAIWGEEADALVTLFESIPSLLEVGRVVWAHVVQANTGIYEQGLSGLPGEIVYDPQGLLSPQELAPIAKTLFGLRQREGELDANDAQQAQLVAIAKHLNAEVTRAFGMPVPRQLSMEPLLLSTIYFERKHLFDGKLAVPYFPVLISDSHPGCAMVLPSRWWPQAMLELCEKARREEFGRTWDTAWEKLAQGRTQEDEVYFQHRVKALNQYAQSGVSAQRAADLAGIGPGIRIVTVPFRADTSPPPFEWEWDLANELRSYAECLLTEVEANRARKSTLLADKAQQSFAARHMATMISLHRLLLCEQRRVPNDTFKIDLDEIQYAALGLAAGCEEAALQLARLLCLALHRTDIYTEFVRPEVRACFLLFAQHLGISIPELVPFKATPHLDALVDNGRWRTANGEALSALLESACAEHRQSAPQGPFQALPAALMLMLKLRAMAGLAHAPVSHPLLSTPLSWPGRASIGTACGDLLTRVRIRMGRNGYRDELVERMLGQQPSAPNGSHVAARTTRVDKERLAKQGALAGADGAAAKATLEDTLVGYLPLLTNWVVLFAGAQNALQSFAKVSGLFGLAQRWLYMGWMVAPYALLAIAALVHARGQGRDGLIVGASLIMSLAGFAVYYLYLPPLPERADAKIFLLMPLAQLAWGCAWAYVALVKKQGAVDAV